MSVTVAQLSAKISIDGSDAAKSVLSSVGQATDGLAAKLKSGLGQAFSLAAGAAGQALQFLGAQMVDSVKDAVNHQQVLSQTVQALKSTKDASGETASSIEALADKFSGLTDYGNDAVESGENLLLTFTGIGKQVFPQATQALLDMSQAMGEDTKSAAIQLGKALNDPEQGLTALTRVGVTFSDSQKKAIASMVAAGNTAGAQKIMLQELEREFGGSAEAAGKTFGGQLQILQNKLEDVKQKIGTAVLPILSTLLSALSTVAMPILTGFSNWFQNTAIPAFQNFWTAIAPIRDAFAQLGNVISTYLLPEIQGIAMTVLPSFSSGADKARGIISGLAGAINTAAGWVRELSNRLSGIDFNGIIQSFSQIVHNSQIMTPVLAGVAGIIGAIVVPALLSLAGAALLAGLNMLIVAAPFVAIGLAVAGLTAAFMHFYQSNAGFRAFVDGFVEGLKQAWSIVQANFLPVMQKLGGYLASTFAPILSKFQDLWQQLVPLFQQLWQAAQPILTVLGAIGVLIVGVLVGAINGIIKALAAVLSDLAPFIGGIVQMFTGLVQIVGGLLKILVDLFTGNFGAIGDDIGMVVQGILNLFGGFFQSLGSLVNAGLAAIINFFIGFVQGVIGFFEMLFDHLVGHSIIPDMINGIINWIAQLPGRALAFVANLYNGFTQKMTSLKNWLLGIGGDILSALQSPFQKAYNFITGLWSGLGQVFRKIIDAIPGADWTLHQLHVPGFALGTNFAPGGLSVVGERGPELMYIPRGAQIIPNNQASGMLGGNQQIVVQPAPVYLDGRQLMNGLMPYLSDAIRYATGARI